MSDTYDPGEHTVEEVKEYVGEHPDETQDILSAEQGGKARVTLVDWLESQLTAIDEPTTDETLLEESPQGEMQPAPQEPTLGEQPPQESDIRLAAPTEQPPLPSHVVKAAQYRTP